MNLDDISPEQRAEVERLTAECARLAQEECKDFLGKPIEWKLDDVQRLSVEHAIAAALLKYADGESGVPLPTGLTVGDLRKSGAAIPDSIPDVAEVWARGVSFKIDRENSTKTEIIGTHEFKGAEFRWTEQVVSVVAPAFAVIKQ